jgi:hypothetical protein
MKTYQEAIQVIAETRAQMLTRPGYPMGTYIPEPAVAVLYGVDEEVVYIDAQMATLARRLELTTA